MFFHYFCTMKGCFWRSAALFLLVLAGMNGYAQGETWEDLLEQRLFPEDEGTAWENVVDELASLHEHPICINTATKEQLE